VNLFNRTDDTRMRQELDEAREAAVQATADAVRLRDALEAVPVGIVIADRNGNIELRNRAATLSGHADVLLKDAVERLIAAARRGDAVEERLNLFGPPMRVLIIKAVPFGNGGALATIDDLSERARLDAVRTDFVSNISHELKTPVGALALLAETLADSDDLEVNRRLANKMVDEAHRAAGTIDDLLELSRIELGGQGERDEVSVSAVMRDAVARHRLTAESFGVEVHLDQASRLGVKGNRLQLVSAVSNLIDNAVKYSNRGGVVNVAAEEVDGAIQIYVADHGVGIPSRDIDRIFERFYRVDRARSRDTGGTGLGLAIVRHIATNHGGDVTVRSREGEGSTFTLRIPIEEN
jgi:two-component system, OmpR family, sensor histidine kinase SenX3